jgi:hypothetical protein
MNWSSLNAFWEWLSSIWETVVPPAPVVFPAEPEGGEVFGRFMWIAFYPTFEEYESSLPEAYLFSSFNEDYSELTFSEFAWSTLEALPAYARGRWDFN